VTRRLDEEQAAVDPGVLDIAFSLGREFLPQVGRVLVLDVLDNWVPAAVIVDKVAVSGRVHNVEPEPNAVLLDHMRHGVDLGRGADRLVGHHATLRVDEMRRKHGIDQRRLAKASLT